MSSASAATARPGSWPSKRPAKWWQITRALAGVATRRCYWALCRAGLYPGLKAPLSPPTSGVLWLSSPRLKRPAPVKSLLSSKLFTGAKSRAGSNSVAGRSRRPRVPCVLFIVHCQRPGRRTANYDYSKFKWRTLMADSVNLGGPLLFCFGRLRGKFLPPNGPALSRNLTQPFYDSSSSAWAI